MSAQKKKLRGYRPLGDDELARLTFYGAAGEVTGSCFLLETLQSRVLIECGMFQGGRGEESRNRRVFPFDPQGIDAVLVTHSHIDHSGLLPKLYRDGCTAPVHASEPTCALLDILLRDAAHIQENDAKHGNRRRRRRGAKLIEPIYTAEDAVLALDSLAPHAFDEVTEITQDVEVRFRRAGHILGASSLEVWVRDGNFKRKLVISGDVGRTIDPLLRDPEPPQEADLLVLESTYGGRDHRSTEESLAEFADALNEAAQHGENVIIPAFAVGRAQEILYTISQLERTGQIRPRPVYFDSPMAIRVTEIYPRFEDCFEVPVPSTRSLEPRNLHICRKPEESMEINLKRDVVILSASGMCDAGRVVHHLKHNLWRPGAHVIIAGFQAMGTRGRALVDGAKKVRIHGEEIIVRAKIHTIGGFSAHAGQSELVKWASPMLASGAKLALIHGEEEEREALAAQFARSAGVQALLPEQGDSLIIRRRGESIGMEPPSRPRASSRRKETAPARRGGMRVMSN